MTELTLEGVVTTDGRIVDIQIADGRIAAVSDSGQAGSASRLVLPGFVEPHAHLDKAFTADLVDNPSGDLMGAIEAWSSYATGLTVEDFVTRATKAALALVANGTTYIRTHADVTTAVGLRAVEALVAVREALRGTVDIEVTALMVWHSNGSMSSNDMLRAALEIGADHVGGCPHLEPDGVRCIDEAIEAAGNAGVGIDLHVDETLDPDVLFLEPLAERIIETGFSGPVMASHCVSLGMQPADVQERVAAKVASAGIGVVALPQTNLYLQARGQVTAPPRGLTAVSALQAAGVAVAAGADNVQDPFNLVGRSDPLETASLMVMAGHMSPADAIDSVTASARQVTAQQPVAIEPGSPADLVLIDAPNVRAAISDAPDGRTVIKAGQVVAGPQPTEGASNGR